MGLLGLGFALLDETKREKRFGEKSSPSVLTRMSAF